MLGRVLMGVVAVLLYVTKLLELTKERGWEVDLVCGHRVVTVLPLWGL